MLTSAALVYLSFNPVAVAPGPYEDVQVTANVPLSVAAEILATV